MTPTRIHPGLFKSRYTALQGRDWLRRVDPDDLQAFIAIGMEYHDHGRTGGKARAQAAKRDARGRFAREETLEWITESSS